MFTFNLQEIEILTHGGDLLHPAGWDANVPVPLRIYKQKKKPADSLAWRNPLHLMLLSVIAYSWYNLRIFHVLCASDGMSNSKQICKVCVWAFPLAAVSLQGGESVVLFRIIKIRRLGLGKAFVSALCTKVMYSSSLSGALCVVAASEAIIVMSCWHPRLQGGENPSRIPNFLTHQSFIADGFLVGEVSTSMQHESTEYARANLTILCNCTFLVYV